MRPWNIVFVVCLIEEHILPVDPLSCMLLDVEEVNICLFATALQETLVFSIKNLQNALWADSMFFAELFPKFKANLVSTLPQLEHYHLARHLAFALLALRNVMA